MALMQKLMAKFRSAPPTELAGIPVASVRDYKKNTITRLGGTPEPFDGPCGDMVIIDLQEAGNYVAARPTGTEPKVKFYMFAYQSAGQMTEKDVEKFEAAMGSEKLIVSDVRRLRDAACSCRPMTAPRQLPGWLAWWRRWHPPASWRWATAYRRSPCRR